MEASPVRNRNLSDIIVPHDIDLEEYPMSGHHYNVQYHVGSSGDLASSSAEIVDSSATHYNNYDTIGMFFPCIVMDVMSSKLTSLMRRLDQGCNVRQAAKVGL